MDVRYDGCTNIWFKNGNGNNGEYIHLCGSFYWDLHVKMLKWIYGIISRYNEDFVGEI